MKRGRTRLLCALGVALACVVPVASPQLGGPAPRAAGAKSGLELHAAIEKYVAGAAVDGEAQHELRPLAAPAPGDEVVYTVTFVNVSDRTADNIRISNPIPPEMRYVADTAVAPGSEALYSVDGGRTYGLPSELFVSADGVSRRADTADYTHIRWLLRAPLDPGAKGFARFRAVVR